MNETIKNIMSRRSIRNFKMEQIKDEELNLIIDAGKYAPSAMNQQSWHFTVIQNPNIIIKVNYVAKEAFLQSDNPQFKQRAQAENFLPFYNAPTLVIVTADEKAIAPQNDGSLAIANMMLAAQSLGIGSCWVHALNFVFKTNKGQELRTELKIPEGYMSVGSLPLGYPGMTSTAAPRKEGSVTLLR